MKNINKESGNKATSPGQRICFDISSTNAYSQGGKKFRLLIIDEFTGYIWSEIPKV